MEGYVALPRHSLAKGSEVLVTLSGTICRAIGDRRSGEFARWIGDDFRQEARDLKVAEFEVVVAQRRGHETEEAARVVRVSGEDVLNQAVASGSQFADPYFAGRIVSENVIALAGARVDVDD